MRPILRPLLFLSVFALASAGAPSFAADPPATKKQGTFGDAKATKGPALTKEELRKCLSLEDSLKTQDADLVKEQAALAAKKTEIGRIGDDLKARLDSIDRTKAEDVASYNEAVQARDKQIDEYQARVEKFNAGVDQNTASHDQFGQACSNRRYLEDDETAIRKGK